MSRITLVRTEQPIPEGPALDQVRAFLFGAIDGAGKNDRSAWGKFWSKVRRLEPGEIFNFEIVFPRVGAYHRRHMAIEQAVFDAQERFLVFSEFLNWIKIGAAWVKWVPGAKGGIVPLPRSISYAKADQAEFELFHGQVVAFLRGEHAAPYLWRHLPDPHGMMDSILQGFDE